jgi:7-cyano-7-deazaguanine synthase
MTPSKLALVVLSGGQDSTTCLALALRDYPLNQVYALTINYGQRHRAEIDAATRVCDIAGMNLLSHHEIVTVPSLLLRGTSPLLMNSGEQVERYKDAATLPGGLEKTFVPMRNQLFLTIAFNRAVLLGLRHGAEVDVFTGVSQEDYGGYPDCRARFINYLERASQLAIDSPELPHVEIKTPLMSLDKEATVRLSETLRGAREMLAYSHTCYNGEVPPCGECHACLLRERGYERAGVLDPLTERVGSKKLDIR